MAITTVPTLQSSDILLTSSHNVLSPLFSLFYLLIAFSLMIQQPAYARSETSPSLKRLHTQTRSQHPSATPMKKKMRSNKEEVTTFVGEEGEQSMEDILVKVGGRIETS